MPSHKAYLEITNRCNLRCAFCPGTARPPRRMSAAEFEALAARLTPWTEYLYFHLMGEPLSHPLLPQFIDRARKLGMKGVITTNGTLLPQCTEALLAAAPYKINISLHAFEANPPGLTAVDYVENCLTFAARAADAGIITVLRLWNLDGAASGAMHAENDRILAEIHRAFPGEWTPARRGERIASRLFLEWGEKFDWPSPDAPENSGKLSCRALRDQLGVLCDGTVVPCCLDSEGRLALGNLYRQTLSEILASPRARAIRAGFEAHRCTEDLCRRCGAAALLK